MNEREALNMEKHTPDYYEETMENPMQYFPSRDASVDAVLTALHSCFGTDGRDRAMAQAFRRHLQEPWNIRDASQEVQQILSASFHPLMALMQTLDDFGIEKDTADATVSQARALARSKAAARI